MEPPKKSRKWHLKKVKKMAGHLHLMPKRLPKTPENTSKTHGVGTSHNTNISINISTHEHSTTHIGSTAHSTATKASTLSITYTV